jgi:heme A synthase
MPKDALLMFPTFRTYSNNTLRRTLITLLLTLIVLLAMLGCFGYIFHPLAYSRANQDYAALR